MKSTGTTVDLRPTAKRPTPANKLSNEEIEQIIQVVNQKEYASLSPAEIVPALADEGIYIASETSFYRVLREFNMQLHRGEANLQRKSQSQHLVLQHQIKFGCGTLLT